MKKKVVLITTGGTIASKRNEHQLLESGKLNGNGILLLRKRELFETIRSYNGGDFQPKKSTNQVYEGIRKFTVNNFVNSSYSPKMNNGLMV